ncbi:hypothetical protein ACWC1D_12280 [Streptomyces sp. NPDC001478]
MLNVTDDGASLTAGTARDPLSALTSAHPLSPTEMKLLRWLEENMAQQDELGHDGTVGWKYRSVYEFVFAYGRWFTPAPLPTQIRPLPARACFTNASAVEREHPSLAYTEGFGLSDGALPTLHAWCTDGAGRVVDPTWSDFGARAYLGIVLPSDLRPSPPRDWGVLEAPQSLYLLLRDGLPGALR